MFEIQFKDCLKRMKPSPLKERLFIHEIMFIKFTLFAFFMHAFPKKYNFTVHGTFDGIFTGNLQL